MTEFNCFRCGYKTKSRTCMKNHFNKKKKCELKLEYLKYNEDQVFRLSFIPYKDALNTVINETENLENVDDNNSKIINKTQSQVLDIIKNIHCDHSKKCPFCNEQFTKQMKLKTHILSFCKNIKIINDEDEINNKNDSVVNNNITYQNTQNTQNNIIFNFYTPDGTKKSIIPFNEKWDTSHISDEAKIKLFLSTVKYTKVLEYILKNEVNLNVLLDKNSESGYVYNNDKIQKMKISDIIEQSMDKLNEHLEDFSKDILNNDIFNINKSIIQNECSTCEKKTYDFHNDENIKKNVETYLSTIYLQNEGKIKENFTNLIGDKDSVEYGF